MPSGGGGSAIVGVSSRSKPRLEPGRRSSAATQLVQADVAPGTRPRSARGRPRPAPRSAARRRRRSTVAAERASPSWSSVAAWPAAQRVRNASSRSSASPSAGSTGELSSTAWPSDSSSFAAASTAATHSGSTSSPGDRRVGQRRRCAACPARRRAPRRRGAAAPARRRGRPAPAPWTASRIAAVSRTERETTSSAVSPDMTSPTSGPSRDPLAGRLQADEAAVAGRDPDRAAAVVGVRDRDHARRRPRPPSRRSSRRSCARCPRGCGVGP